MANKILIVDDEKPIRELLKTAFTHTGYTVFCAANAEEALKIVSKETIQVYLLDMNLPEMDGIELFNRIKENRPVSFFFAITGFTSIFDLVRCRKVGFDNYFPKPFKIELLLKATKEAFENLERWRIGQKQLKKVLANSGSD